ncbi:MAG TPA: sensor domain-containing diguanylate cyclase [Microvirga sp.]|jgi:diguanylate cyclase (GGDEF)-like protein/PAS domain S-box-containing protein|nr:sensor domain-containing diguanylate cyclase [Microvirga sp.]
MDLMPSITELQAENESLLEFLYVCPVGLARIGADGTVEMMNPHAAQILMPITREPFITNLFTVLEGCAPEIRNMAEGFAEPRGTVCEAHRIYVGPRDGTDTVVLSCTMIKLDAARFMVVMSDISRQVAQERRLKQTEAWFAAILNGVNDFALLTLDSNGRINSWNESGFRQTGYREEEVLRRTLNLFYYPEEAIQGRALQQVDLARRDGWHIDEGWRRRKDGRRYWCQSLVAALKEDDGQVTGYSVVLRDVTERKSNGDDLRRLLTTDHLTGVANRARFFELAEAEEFRWSQYGQPLSGLMIDADHFKKINDAYGHHAGDAVLKALAATCKSMLRSVDILGRLGGEEFAILLPTIDIEGALIVAERLRREVANSVVEVDGVEIRYTVSVGCATMGGRVTNTSRLLQAADEALYSVKRGTRNAVAAYSPHRAIA